MTQSEQTRPVNVKGDLEREVLPGIVVGRFPADAHFATIGHKEDRPIGQPKGVYRVPRRVHVGAVLLLAIGAAGAAVIPWRQFESVGSPGGAGPRLRPEPVEVQRASRLIVAPTIVAEPSSRTPLKVIIGAGEPVPAESFLHLSGLPSAILLSAGRAIGPNEWVIPVSDLSNLAMNIPADVSGKFELDATLLGGWDGTRFRLTAVAKALLIIGPRGAATVPTGKGPRVETAEAGQGTNAADPRPSPADRRTASQITPESLRRSAPTEGPSLVPAIEADPGNEKRVPKAAQATPGAALEITPEFPSESALPGLVVKKPSPIVTAEPNRGSYEPAATAGTGAAVVIAPKPMGGSADQGSVAKEPSSVASAKRDRSGDGPVQPTDARTAPAIARDPRRESATSGSEGPPMRAGGAESDRSEERTKALRLPTPEERERAEKLVDRGQHYLEDGDVGLARQLFLRAAEMGLARGALLVAATYDPRELASLRVLGVQPNPGMARKWYERARALGAPEAEERLARLSGAD